MTEQPDDSLDPVTTSFLVVQLLDGQVAVVPETGLEQIRQATSRDVYMMSNLVSQILAAELFQPMPPAPKTTAQTLQEKLAERNRDAQPE